MSLKYILFLFYFATISVGCNDDLNHEFGEQRANFFGDWHVNELFKQYNNGAIEYEFTREYELEMHSDGMAFERNISIPNGIIDTLQWFYQYNPARIVFIENVSGIISNAIIYDIVELDDNSMTWNAEYSISQFGGNLANIERLRSITKK